MARNDGPKRDLGEIVGALKANQPKRAEKLLRPLLKRNPRSGALNDLAGVAWLQLGDPAKAARSFEMATRAEPGNANFQHHLAEACRGAGRYDAAIPAYRAALSAKPDHAASQMGLAAALEAIGDPEAPQAYERALELSPTDTALLIRLSGLRAGAGALDEAIELLRRATRLQPGLAPAQNNLGVLLTEAGEVEPAVAALRQACALAPDRADYHFNRAVALNGGGRYDQAVEAYRRVLALDADHVAALAGLASLEERRSRLDEARTMAERALRLVPSQAEAGLTLARLARRAGELDRSVELLGPLLAQDDLPVALACSAASELGMIQDRRNDAPAAIAAFERANALHDESAAAARIDREAFPRDVAAIRAYADTADFASWPKAIEDGAGDPAFLVGFPRSGTTLTEQCLAAHPGLATTDEEPILTRIVQRIVEITGEAYPQALDALDNKAIGILRAEYFEAARAIIGDDPDKRLVDKLPLNLIHLPAIRRLFPQASVIVALRDPRDVVLSAWMQNFNLNQAMIQFLRIERAAETYASVMDLWLALRDRVDLSLIEHRYEDMVVDAEAATRRLIDFLGLEWDDAVLAFGDAARSRVISTPSARDVASGGVFTRAKGRWTRYREHLAPALPKLERFVATFGYDEAAGAG